MPKPTVKRGVIARALGSSLRRDECVARIGGDEFACVLPDTSLDDATQQNSAMVEQSAAAAQSMREQADRLAEVVRQFRLESQGQLLLGRG